MTTEEDDASSKRICVASTMYPKSSMRDYKNKLEISLKKSSIDVRARRLGVPC